MFGGVCVGIVIGRFILVIDSEFIFRIDVVELELKVRCICLVFWCIVEVMR